MKVSGFTFIRNGIKFGYPFTESIRSILPICDEFVIALGDCTDGTREAILAIDSPKIKIIDTIWDESKRDGGRILAEQTNIALDHISGDWGFYLQGDEVVHERYFPVIRKAMEAELNNEAIDGLLFNYLHFYGSYDFVATARNWYRKEIRIVRNDKRIRSWGDAQGFRRLSDSGSMEKLTVKQVDAYIYHYGWVKPPKVMQEKLRSFHKLWHSDEWVDKEMQGDEFDYSNINALARFTTGHPVTMHCLIEKKNWPFEPPQHVKVSFKHWFSNTIEQATGIRLGEYKNYKLVK
ncbi:MAG TPA: glycosyltransferase family 2 protein [Candidatus Kapabacteria bacterium]|nr:glycosyltransferase family 2 protein [Candidatus Kapabacteria bacterium]